MPLKKNLLVDCIAFVSLLLVMDPRLTGIAAHEWLSVAFTCVLVVHLLLHWTWLENAVKRFIGAAGLTRFKLVLTASVLIGFTVATFSGFMISESILELFGARRSANMSWREVHEISSNLTLLLVGIHVALDWGWIKSAVRSVVTLPSRKLRVVQARPVTVQANDNNETGR